MNGGQPADWFRHALETIAAIHDKKGHDYGTEADPNAAINAAERFGIPGWLNAVIRGEDKSQRIAAYIRNGELKNEDMSETLLDRAAYAVIAYALWLNST